MQKNHKTQNNIKKLTIKGMAVLEGLALLQ